MKLKHFILLLICITVLLIPLDNFFLKWLNLNSISYIWFSQFPDLMIFVSFILSVYSNKKKLSLVDKQAEIFLLLFIVITLVNVTILQTSIFSALTNLKSLFRYVLILYIFLNLKFNPKELKYVYQSIKLILIAEVSVGIIQLFLSTQAKLFWVLASQVSCWA